MKIHRDFRPIVKALKAAGHSVGMTGGTHIVVEGANGARVFGPSTPSDRRSVKNFRAECRRQGLL